MENLKADMVQTKFDPDIIINLCDLTLAIAGDANKGVSVMTSQPMMEIPGEYSSISPTTNYYGYIHMDYTATWEIVDVKKDQKKQIQLTGRYVSRYHPKYSMYTELMLSAKKAGKDFAALIK